MNTDKIIALFFYFACMDEKLIRSFTKKTLALLKKEKVREAQVSRIVFYCHKILSKKKWDKKYVLMSNNSYVRGDKSVQLTCWFDFLKESDPDIVTAIIFKKILNVSNIDIMKGLNISEGTLRYRLGKGLEKLSEILNPGDMD